MNRTILLVTLFLCFATDYFTISARAQTAIKTLSPPSTNANGGNPDASANSSELEEIKTLLRNQQSQLDKLSAIILEQAKEISGLKAKVQQNDPSALIAVHEASGPESNRIATEKTPPQANLEERVTKVEKDSKSTAAALGRQLGSIAIAGDLRIQYESFYHQLNPTANAANPSILGNQLSARNRLRMRARLSLRGQANSQFDWGVRFATGLLDDPISPNQILTDFYNRKQFALDQAYIGWNSRSVPGLRIVGGKFETPWIHTEMTFDNDINPEGISETYSHDFRSGRLKNLAVALWQLPFLERNSAFVRNANGTVNLNQSRRDGRDLALYGGQVRGRIDLSPQSSLTLSASNLFYSGTQLISPVQFFGPQLQLPVSFTIPATATAPAQTITTQVIISRDLLVAGANLGMTTATNNAINRDGTLSSGFNLIDLIGRLDLAKEKRFPVSLIYNFVLNTRTHDVIIAGPGGVNSLLPNRENKGHWAEIQIGRRIKPGDILLGYMFTRIDKDAILTPFNYSEIAQQSDVRAQRFVFYYTVDPHVVLGINGIFTKRANGVLGAFGNTPPGSLNPATIRIQFETQFRF